MSHAAQTAPPLVLYDVEEAAKILRVSPWGVRKAIQRGRLRSYRPGRRRLISLEDLRAYLERSASCPRRAVKRP